MRLDIGATRDTRPRHPRSFSAPVAIPLPGPARPDMRPDAAAELTKG